MAEYIEREAFITYIRKEAEGLHTRIPMDLTIEAVANEAKAFPAADVSPIRHGRWIKKPYLLGISRFCSACGSNYGMPHEVYNYCPNCGTLMDNEVDDGDV